MLPREASPPTKRRAEQESRRAVRTRSRARAPRRRVCRAQHAARRLAPRRERLGVRAAPGGRTAPNDMRPQGAAARRGHAFPPNARKKAARSVRTRTASTRGRHGQRAKQEPLTLGRPRRANSKCTKEPCCGTARPVVERQQWGEPQLGKLRQCRANSATTGRPAPLTGALCHYWASCATTGRRRLPLLGKLCHYEATRAAIGRTLPLSAELSCERASSATNGRATIGRVAPLSGVNANH